MIDRPIRPSHGTLAIAGLLLLASLGFGFLWRPEHTLYSKHSDAVASWLGAKEALHGTRFRPPFWQESQMSGGPALTNPQALFFHPLHALFHVMPPAAAAGPTVWLNFLVAGLGFLALGRTLGLGTLPAFFMGVAGMFNFKLILAAYAGWLPVLPGIALSPWIARGVLRLTQQPGLSSCLGLAVVAALGVQSGHVQVVYYTSVASATYLLVKAVRWTRDSDFGRLRRVPPLAAVSGLLALGLSSYLVLPIASELHLVSRGNASYEYFLSGHAAKPALLATFVFPEALGSPLDGSYPGIELWEDDAYFGLIPLALAGCAVWLSSRRETVRGLALAFVLSFVLAMDTPVLRALWSVLPGFSWFRCPARMLFLTSFMGITLAGFGVEALLSRLESARSRGLFALAAVLAVAAEGSFYARRYLTMLPAGVVLPTPAYRELFAHDRSLYRVAPLRQGTVNFGWASALGLQLVSGYEPYILSHYRTYVEIMATGAPGPDEPRTLIEVYDIARPDLLEALNVKYLLSPVELRFADDRFKLIAALPDQPIFTLYQGMTRGPIFVYRHERPLLRAFWVEEVLGVADEGLTLRAMEAHPLYGWAVAALPVRGSQASPRSDGDRVGVLGFEPGHLTLSLYTAQRRFLVISEVWHPGWRATLDGQPLALYRTDHALLGAWVPGGSHRLEVEFRPIHWELGRDLTLVSLGVLLSLGGLSLARRVGRSR